MIMENVNNKDLLNKIISEYEKKLDLELWKFFEPYLREAGIKGEITRGKIKYRGIKLKVHNDFGSSYYQLNQRGVDISPVFHVQLSNFLNE